MDLSKYFNSETRQVLRSEIHLSDYNPRKIDEEGKKQLKRSIKKYGVVGGIVVNSQTGNTIVGGHQKVKILDELNKYPDSDYTLKVEVVDVDAKTEKQLNIILNNPNVGGTWDYDALARIVPDIDYKDAGLTDADLNMIGVDYLLQTEEENDLASELDNLMQPVAEQHQSELEARRAEREAQKQAEAIISQQEKIQAMKDLKQQVKEKAQEKAADMDAYIMLSFNNYQAKEDFLAKYGMPAMQKFIKGETFDEQLEIIING